MVRRALRQGLERRLSENGWSGKLGDLSSIPAAHKTNAKHTLAS